MRPVHLDPAVPPGGTDPRQYARLLARAHEAVLSGEAPPASPRPVIQESWQRMLATGVDPDRGADTGPLSVEEVEHQRRTCGLSEVLDTLRGSLLSIADASWHILVIADPEGRVLWRGGSRAVLTRAQSLGFVEGASWSESAVGTNAIGTALVARRPVQVHSAEHFVRTHHAWTCAAAPIRSPRDGRLLGVIDVSGPASTFHPSTLALVDAVGRLAEAELRTAHLGDLERLRAVAAPVLARIPDRAVVADRHGWVAAVSGLAPVDRVTLPVTVQDGQVWLPTLGRCAVEPLPGGWLLRVMEEESAAPTRIVLDVRQPRQASLTVEGPSGTWTHELSPRHAEVLLVLAEHPAGRTAAQLADDLFGDPGRTVTVRAEVSRLRRQLAGLLQHRPYRFADGARIEVVRPDDPSRLLPHSTAPAVCRLRRTAEAGRAAARDGKAGERAEARPPKAGEREPAGASAEPGGACAEATAAPTAPADADALAGAGR
ncbi:MULTISPECIES: GAF domain-containing protein [unclassified Streptomyces]|uniref:helix-turn-helix domain-containing protein n=1 Tax=unclassified Streptomyces TaxID=2593676 RepID=UPI0037005529